MAQKAAARGVSIIELVREDIAKMEASGIPAESGLMDDEPLVLDPNISVHDVPVEPPGFHGSGKRRGGRAKRTEAAAPAVVVPAATTATKVSTRPSIRFTPAAEPTPTEMRNIVAELRQAQDMNRQIMLHHTQMMEVMFRELQRVKSMNRQLMQHAGLSLESIVDEELPINPLAGSSLSQSSVIAPPNSLASSYAIDISSHGSVALDQSAHVEPQSMDAAHPHVDTDADVDAMDTTTPAADVEMKDETVAAEPVAAAAPSHADVAPTHDSTTKEEEIAPSETPVPVETAQSEAPAPEAPAAVEAKEDGTDDEVDETPVEPQM